MAFAARCSSCPALRWPSPLFSRQTTNGRTRRSAPSCFPARAAFPVSQAGRRPRFPLRGLLRLTARYGLPACSPSFPWTLSPGFRPADCSATLLVSFPAYRQLHRWVPSSHRVSAPKRRTEKCGLGSPTPRRNARRRVKKLQALMAAGYFDVVRNRFAVRVETSYGGGVKDEPHPGPFLVRCAAGFGAA